MPAVRHSQLGNNNDEANHGGEVGLHAEKKPSLSKQSIDISHRCPIDSGRGRGRDVDRLSDEVHVD